MSGTKLLRSSPFCNARKRRMHPAIAWAALDRPRGKIDEEHGHAVLPAVSMIKLFVYSPSAARSSAAQPVTQIGGGCAHLPVYASCLGASPPRRGRPARKQ